MAMIVEPAMRRPRPGAETERVGRRRHWRRVPAEPGDPKHPDGAVAGLAGR